jgi:hypothetical protein
VIVTLTADGALVRDADDCGRLQVETELSGDDLRTALATTGTGAPADDEHVWLDLATLRSRAGLLAADPDWPQRWEAMVDAAQRSGWLSPDGLAVRARID